MRSRSFLLATIVLGCSVLVAAPVLPATQPACDCDCQCPAASAEKNYRCGRWFVVETENFQACSQQSQQAAQLIARRAENLRAELQRKWLGGECHASWTPKCQILLQPNLQSYVAAVGRGGQRTVGSSLVKVDERRIVGRRIDLLGDRPDCLSAALPHELTHVVLKDRFPIRGLPRWADEGAAILADDVGKQHRHFRDLAEAVAQGTMFDTRALLCLNDYPGPDRVGAFYGQSASLVAFLVKRGGAEKFVDFVQRASESGYDAALMDCYGMRDVQELSRLWVRDVRLALDQAPDPDRSLMALQ